MLEVENESLLDRIKSLEALLDTTKNDLDLANKTFQQFNVSSKKLDKILNAQ